MKKVIAVIFCLLLSGAIVFGWPLLFSGNNVISTNYENTQSIINQKVLAYDEVEHHYNKIYRSGKLIGVINDYSYIEEKIQDQYINYEEDFPNSELGLGEDIYVVPETSFAVFENIDDKIMDYLITNTLLGVKTTAIEFSTSEGVYDVIYVRDIEDFYKARDNFLLNFISEDSLNKLRNGEVIESPENYGSVDTGIYIQETITNKDAVVSPNKIFKNVSEIYTYLCYGRSEDRTYYTVKEGDTLQGVGYYFGDMSPKQLVMLNPDILTSEKQIITPGIKLNVSYYNSPITVVVTKEDLSMQLIYPDNPTYIQDDTIQDLKVEVRVAEKTGTKNVLYEEKWINGVLQGGTLKSETVIEEAIQGVMAIGTRGQHLAGTTNFMWPIDNPTISCHFGCYLGHTGTDFVNKYNHYGNVYAVDSGIVYNAGYQSDMGNFIMIDHQNGLKTWYMHLNVPAFYSAGDYVERGTTIGQIGNTGKSEGAHLHLQVLDDDQRVNACYYLPCALLEG